MYERLSEILKKYSNNSLDALIPNKEQFAKEVRDSRNYYTHYPKKLEKRALKGSKLYRTSESLKLLLVCAFLEEIGIEKELLKERLKKVEWVLFNHLLDSEN